MTKNYKNFGPDESGFSAHRHKTRGAPMNVTGKNDSALKRAVLGNQAGADGAGAGGSSPPPQDNAPPTDDTQDDPGASQ